MTVTAALTRAAKLISSIHRDASLTAVPIGALRLDS